LDAITNIGGAYILPCGTNISAGTNIDTGLNTVGTYCSVNGDRTGSLTGTVPWSGSGVKIITYAGYRAATLRQFAARADNDLYYRSSQDTGTTWGKWYKFAFIPSVSDNKTFSAIGSSS